MGVDFHVRLLQDCNLTSVVERTKAAPRGLFGGGDARPNQVIVDHPDGSTTTHGKDTAVVVEQSSLFKAHSGGGGGYGPAGERDLQLIEQDLLDGYVTPEHVKRWYPHYGDPSKRSKSS